MISPDLERVRIYLQPGRTDIREANELSQIVEQEIGKAPIDGDLFLFSNGKRLVKILYWGRNGFCLWQRRPEQDRFPGLQNEAKSGNRASRDSVAAGPHRFLSRPPK